MLDDLINRGKIKKVSISEEMYLKEFSVGMKDLNTAVETFEFGNYKWATIQAYYAIFHGVRAMLFKAGYREESHAALKKAFDEIYVKTDRIDAIVLETLRRGMNLREMADYKDKYSKSGAENLLKNVEISMKKLKDLL
ncbi:MAG: HEPN domain-containing protein [Clostridiales bacterium]|nr:HEPN domain-containing protein [Clostridiales bacterium]